MPNPNSQSKLKILMITCLPFFSSRGTPISIRSRLETLSNLGHEVDVITYHIGEDLDIPGIKILRTTNLPFIKDVPVGPSLKKIFLNIFVFFKSLRHLIFGKYDIIHTHEEASYFGAFFSKTFKIRHVYDFHSSLPQSMKNFGYERYKPLIYLLELLEKKVVNSSQGLITISAVLKDYLKELNNNKPTVIIENFRDYDLNFIDKEPIGSFELLRPNLEGKDVILYSGTFEHYQGLELLLAAAELVLKKRGDIVFILVGGRQNQIDKLRNSAEKLGIESHVHFTGNIPINELAPFLNAANVLVSTRTIGSNPPLKIYDYLKAGKPIVATNVIAHTQVLNDDIAVLVDPNPESVSRGITSVIDNYSYANTLGQNSRKFFENNYSSQEKIDRTKKILDVVMRENL